MEDERIVELFWRRSEEAIRETEAKYGSYCHKTAMSILGSAEDAEECVNDTLLRAWESIPPQRPAVFKSFLIKIVRSLALDRFRANSALKRGGGQLPLVLDELRECIGGSGDASTEAEARELGNAIREFVGRLPERERIFFVRRYFFTASVSDIAKGYDTSAGAVSASLDRTRKKLKNYLEKEGLMQ